MSKEAMKQAIIEEASIQMTGHPSKDARWFAKSVYEYFMSEQPAREPLTPAQKIALAEDWFAEDWAITKAVGMMVEYEMRVAHGITKGGAA